MVPIVKFEKKPKKPQPPPLPKRNPYAAKVRLKTAEELANENLELRRQLKLMEDRAILATFFLSLLAEHSQVAHVGLRLVQKVAR